MGNRRGSKQADEGVDAGLTEAHTPVLGLASDAAKISTMLTIAASTQSPRMHSPVLGLCKHEAAEVTNSPCSAAGAAELAPPVLSAPLSSVPSSQVPAVHTLAKPSLGSQRATTHGSACDEKFCEQHSCCMQEGIQPHAVSRPVGDPKRQLQAAVAGLDTAAVPAVVVAEGSQCRGTGVACGAQVAPPEAADTAAAGSNAVTGGPAGASAAVPEGHGAGAGPAVEEASSDDDELLFAVDLTNLGSASAAPAHNQPHGTVSRGPAAGGAGNVVSGSMTQSLAAPQALAPLGKPAPQDGYNAAAEAVIPQSRLQHASEGHIVKGLAAWGQHEHGLTLVQQREVDRHIVQQVCPHSQLPHTCPVKLKLEAKLMSLHRSVLHALSNSELY